MIKRSFDLELLLRATDHPNIHSSREDFVTWFNMPKNLMFAEGENVGLATYELPGIYNIHWYFKVRGREALNLARDMLENLFENYDVEVVRGIVRVDLKPSRWGARQVGLTSLGVFTYPDGTENEVFYITKTQFLNSKGKHNG